MIGATILGYKRVKKNQAARHSSQAAVHGVSGSKKQDVMAIFSVG